MFRIQFHRTNVNQCGWGWNNSPHWKCVRHWRTRFLFGHFGTHFMCILSTKLGSSGLALSNLLGVSVLVQLVLARWWLHSIRDTIYPITKKSFKFFEPMKQNRLFMKYEWHSFNENYFENFHRLTNSRSIDTFPTLSVFNMIGYSTKTNYWLQTIIYSLNTNSIRLHTFAYTNFCTITTLNDIFYWCWLPIFNRKFHPSQKIPY